MRRIAIAFALSLVALSASATKLEETFDKTYDVRPGSSLSLENVNGHITVRAWDQPRVRVHALKRVEASGQDKAREVMAKLQIEVANNGGGLKVLTRYPNKVEGDLGFLSWLFADHVNASVEYELMVPRAMNLDLDNTNGTIEVSDIRGSHRIDTTNGRIELERCAGDLEAETTNGGIRAELTEVTPGKSVRLETTNGRISLAAPPTLAANLDAATTNGSINTDLPVATTRAARHSLRGAINGGGPELRLRTTNGSIDIRAAR